MGNKRRKGHNINLKWKKPTTSYQIIVQSQLILLPFNIFLWLALSIKEGGDGLHDYENVAMFENVKSMRSLASKVLSRIKDVQEEG